MTQFLNLKINFRSIFNFTRAVKIFDFTASVEDKIFFDAPRNDKENLPSFNTSLRYATFVSKTVNKSNFQFKLQAEARQNSSKL